MSDKLAWPWDPVMQKREEKALVRGAIRVCEKVFQEGGNFVLECSRPYGHQGKHAASKVLKTISASNSEILPYGLVRVVTHIDGSTPSDIIVGVAEDRRDAPSETPETADPFARTYSEQSKSSVEDQ